MEKKFSAWLIKSSGLPIVFRRICQKNKVTILCYHRIAADRFDEHLTVLKKYYNIIPLQSYLNGETGQIKYRLIITFDDGHAGNFDLLPVLQKHDVQITVFLTTGLLDTRRHFWFLIDEMREPYKQSLKKMGDDVRLQILRDRYHYSDDKEYDNAQSLSRNQIYEMMGHVDFQSHTVTHPILTMCPENKALEEIRLSKEHLETLLNKKINCIAFPNDDFSGREIEMSLKMGYEYVHTGEPGFNGSSPKNILLKRISTNDTHDVNELLLRVTGIWYVLKKGLKKSK